MKFTEVPYYILKDFLLKSPGVSAIPYSVLITMNSVEIKRYIEYIKKEWDGN